MRAEAGPGDRRGEAGRSAATRRVPAGDAGPAAGEITAPHAGRLVEATFELDAKTTTAVEERVLTRAAEQTPSQFRAGIRRAVLALTPRKREEERRAEAVAQPTADQRRADALPELIFGTTSVRPNVNVTVALSTSDPPTPHHRPHHHRSYWASEPRSETPPDQHAMSPPAATRPERQRGAA